MRGNSFQAIKFIERFNIARNKQINESPVITGVILSALFKECGMPSGAGFINEFLKSPLVTKVTKGVYIWNDPKKPVHYQTLQDIYTRHMKKNRGYVERYRNKIKSSQEEQAISFLKEKGYIILAQEEGNVFRKI